MLLKYIYLCAFKFNLYFFCILGNYPQWCHFCYGDQRSPLPVQGTIYGKIAFGAPCIQGLISRPLSYPVPLNLSFLLHNLGWILSRPDFVFYSIVLISLSHSQLFFLFFLFLLSPVLLFFLYDIVLIWYININGNLAVKM